MIRGLFQRLLQGAVPIAPQAVMDGLRSHRAAGFQPREKRCQRLRANSVPLSLGGGFVQAGKQDIQVAHFAEQPSQPLQLSLNLLTPFFTDLVLECTKLATKPAGGSSQAMHSLRVATPGQGLVSTNPCERRPQCQRDGVP